MFSLIIIIIAVALVAMVALSSLYYGGTAMNEGTDKAATSRFLSEGTQIQAALQLYRVDHDDTLPTGTVDEIKQILLDGHYLKSWPNNTWTLVNDYAVRTDLSTQACLDLNAKLGVSTIPSCSDPAFSNRNLCCQTL